jgi:hypothetical protein
MGLVSLVLGLPVAPFRGVVALAEVIQDRVNQEMYDPASVRQELEAAEEQRAAGEITPEEEAEVQQDVVERMAQPAEPGTDEER